MLLFFFTCPAITYHFLWFNPLVLTWWPWVQCLWPWCSSARPSCSRHAPSGRLTTTSWSWIRSPCPGRKLNLLNVTSGVFWVRTRWCCPTRSPDTQERVQRRGRPCLSYRCRNHLLFKSQQHAALCLRMTGGKNEAQFVTAQQQTNLVSQGLLQI